MDCLLDYISPHNNCGGPTPLSGMYLNQLPGIEFDNIEQIANADQVDWKGVWDDLQATCKDTFREDIITEFGKRYLLKQITQTVDLGRGINESILTAPPAGGISNGILCETSQPGSQCVGSNLMGMYVQSVTFFWKGVDPNPTFTVTFKDADTGVVELTKVVTAAAAGWNTVWIDQGFSARRMYVLVTGNFDNYVQQDLSNFILDNFGSYIWGFASGYSYMYFNWGTCGIQSRINGVAYNAGSNSYTTGLNSFGLSMVFSTKCSWDNVVCKNKKHFASAWQHRLAIELLNYRINTSRINRWVTLDKGQAEKLQALLMKKYYGGEGYPIGKLRSACESLAFNDSDGCLKMNDYLMFTEARL